MTCACGKRMSRFSPYCRACAREKAVTHAKEYVRVDKGGVCPTCGNKLSFNNSLAGTMWLQCLRREPTCGYQILADRDRVEEVLKETV